MRLFIGLVTEDASLRRHFGQGKEGVVPRDSLSRGYFRDRTPQVSVGAWVPEEVQSRRNFERFLLGELHKADAVILLVDARWSDYVADVRWPTFTIVFSSDEVEANRRNFFHKLLGRVEIPKGQDQKFAVVAALKLGH